MCTNLSINIRLHKKWICMHIHKILRCTNLSIIILYFNLLIYQFFPRINSPSTFQSFLILDLDFLGGGIISSWDSDPFFPKSSLTKLNLDKNTFHTHIHFLCKLILIDRLVHIIIVYVHTYALFVQPYITNIMHLHNKNLELRNLF
jgi:hypothetical protein